jgi:hypothetical protein
MREITPEGLDPHDAKHRPNECDQQGHLYQLLVRLQPGERGIDGFKIVLGDEKSVRA